MFSCWQENWQNLCWKYCLEKKRLAFCCCLGLGLAVSANGQMDVDGQTLVDPTRPAGWAQPPAAKSHKTQHPEVRIDYIIHSKLRRLVSINGQSLVEGERWNDIKVIRVEPKRVLLAWRGQQWFSSIASSVGLKRKSLLIRRTE